VYVLFVILNHFTGFKTFVFNAGGHINLKLGHAACVTPMMEEARNLYQATRRYDPKDSHPHGAVTPLAN
jgi:hypothetical protein